MKIIQLREQKEAYLPLQGAASVLPYMEDGSEVVFTVKRGREDNALCLGLKRNADSVFAKSSYFVGIDWIKEKELAVQVCPKMNDEEAEIDYVRMLNEALCEPENAKHLEGLITIKFDKPSIKIGQQQDILSLFLITEYLNLLQQIVRKGLKRSFYSVEENLQNKIKGKILVGKNIQRNLAKGKITDNVCSFQVYETDSDENRILKKALKFCAKQLAVVQHAETVRPLKKKVLLVSPYFEQVGDYVSIQTVKGYKGNPVFKEYSQAIRLAQLLLRRYSYDITRVGRCEIPTPPFWIDMSKLFELYVYRLLREVFTKKGEVVYHPKVHKQELDYLLRSTEWPEPYVVDAKYKPRYNNDGILLEDARELAGYARLSGVYKKLGLDEETALPIKCLIVCPDQEQEETFRFTRHEEPRFEKFKGYVRMYKVGVRLPVVNEKQDG